MALATRSLWGTTTRAALESIEVTYRRTVEFAAGVTATYPLAIGAAVAYDTATSSWKPWVNAGAAGIGIIRGFVWPEAITLDASNTVLGTVMLGGTIHITDIETGTVAAQGSSAQIRAACAKAPDYATDEGPGPSLRELGINVLGIPEVN